MNIHKILSKKFAHRTYICRGESVTFLDDGPDVTEQELLAAEQEILAEEAATKYQSDRAAEYPTIDEMTIALWERSVEGRPECCNQLELKRQEIKNKYPKPGE